MGMSRSRVTQRPGVPGDGVSPASTAILGPAPESHFRPPEPATVVIGEWYHHGWQIQASCSCGRSSIVHLGNVIRKLGNGFHFTDHSKARVSQMLTCIRCGNLGPSRSVWKG